jgi:hypothetical protein
VHHSSDFDSVADDAVEDQVVFEAFHAPAAKAFCALSSELTDSAHGWIPCEVLKRFFGCGQKSKCRVLFIRTNVNEVCF